MMFCLDDGAELLYGPASGKSEPGAVATGFTTDEPQTAILHETAAPGDTPTRAQIYTTEQTAVLPRGAEAKPQDSLSDSSEKQSFFANRAAKPLIATAIAVVILVAGFGGYRYFSGAGSQHIRSIAIMPFSNDSGDPDVEYLSDGITESLISSLSQLEHLSVKPRSSVFRYKGTGKDPETAGKELAVDALLTGRVTQRGDDLSFFVELVNVALDKVIWSRQYSGKQADLVTLQRGIATDVSSRLMPSISDGDTAKVARTYTSNPEAYQHYLKGNFNREKWTEEGYKKAIEHYNKAIESDPAYGLAYAGMAMAHLVSSDWFVPPNEAAPRVKAAASKALELDPSLSLPHVALGLVALWCDSDWPTTEREAKRAIELDPDNAKAYQLYGWYYSVLGQTGAAIEQMNKAVSLEPLNSGMIGDLAYVLIQAGRIDEGMQVAKQGSGLNANDWWINLVLANGYERKGQMTEALREIDRAYELNNSPVVLCYVGYIKAVSGRTAEARQIARELEEISKHRHVSPYYLASVHAGLDERDAAFALLEKSAQQRASLAGLGTEWIFEKLRPDPRFNVFLDRLNLSHLK
jgi:TolB-like protein/tetratricopeptide (TPR) repeat protein